MSVPEARSQPTLYQVAHEYDSSGRSTTYITQIQKRSQQILESQRQLKRESPVLSFGL